MISWLNSEEEILRRIASSKQRLANTIHFALNSAFPDPEHAFGQSIFLGINIPREKLGLEPGMRPGDIDYLIIPFTETEILIDRTIAIEAKIVRPSIANPARNANAMGRTQAEGLLRDGFPFVGLVHIVVPEVLPKEWCWPVPHISNKVDAGGGLVLTGEYHLVDPFPLASTARQEGRLKTLDLPRGVAYRTIAMTLVKDGQQFCGNTFDDEHLGERNPSKSGDLTRAIHRVLESEPRLFRTIHWYR